eukprot:COSAG01_NODE_4884_length_4653_cov_20.654370_4_plen_261_part_00
MRSTFISLVILKKGRRVEGQPHAASQAPTASAVPVYPVKAFGTGVDARASRACQTPTLPALVGPFWMLGCVSFLGGLLAASHTTAARNVPPPPAPCLVATPAGFTPALRRGWYQTTPIPKPSENERHGVSVTCCAAFCVADQACLGFEVYRPCGISDCYIFHAYSSENFTLHAGAHTFTRPAGSAAGPPVPASCTPKPKPAPGQNGTLCGHTVVLDTARKILPWSADNKSAGAGPGSYEHAARVAWYDCSVFVSHVTPGT